MPQASPYKNTGSNGLASFLTLALFLLLISCNKTCQPGYQNPNCSVETRSIFESLSYTATESENGDSAFSYTTTIIAGPLPPFQVWLSTVAGGYFHHYVLATVANDTLNIALQAPDSNGRYISGTAVLNQNVLSINYTIAYPIHPPFHFIQTDSYSGNWVHN